MNASDSGWCGLLLTSSTTKILWTSSSSLAQRKVLQDAPLASDQCFNSSAGELHHFLELGIIKRVLFRRGLNFHDFSSAGHYEVHIDFGLRVFFISQIEQDFAFDNAYADRGNVVANRRCRKTPRLNQLGHCQSQGNKSAGN